MQDDPSSGGGVRLPISGTPIPLGFTTTIRPPGKPASVSGFLSGRNLKTLSQEDTVDQLEDTVDQLQPDTDNGFPEETLEPTEAPEPRFFGGAGRKPKVKSNLKAANFHKGARKQLGGVDGTSRDTERKRFRSFREPEVSHNNRFQEPEPRELDSEPLSDEFEGPEVRPDGRVPRVKGDLLAEIQNNPETTTIPPFIDAFFASPSSPKPFLFRGAPLEEDLFGSASTAQPFFLPTAKSPTFSGISQTPLTSGFKDAFSFSTEPSSDTSEQNINDIEADQEETDPTDTPTLPNNRFRSRPSPSRFDGRRRGQTSRFTTETTEDSTRTEDNAEINTEADPVEQKSTPTVRRFPKKSFNSKVGFEDSTGDSKFSLSGDLSSRRGPRVKSNIRAKTRNYWQQSQSQGIEDAGAEGRKRKLRRGRKQRVEETANLVDPEESMDKDIEDQKDMEDHDIRTKEEEKVEAKSENLLQQFFPTPTPEQRLPETSVPTLTEEEDIFEDLFEQDDLIVSSSTVSSVVFKGSPSPAPFGFFSSPSPNFDQGSGVFVASPRPSFSNIGNDIDLGPKKFLSPDQFVFVTSTQSNKIFIGSSEEPSAPAAPAAPVLNSEEKRTFPSFPIRGKSLSFPFRPKPSFAPPKPIEVDTTTDAIDEDEETRTTEITEITPVTSQSTGTTTLVSEPTRFNPFRGGNRNFKSLFGRSQGEPTRSRFNPFAASTTLAEVEAEATTAATTPTTTPSTEAATAVELLEELLTTLEPENIPRRRFPSALRQNVVGIKPFRGAGRSRQTFQEVAEPETTTEIIVPTDPEPVTEKVTEPSLLLSVESELAEDEDFLNEISVDEDDEPEERIEPEQPENFNFRQFSGVKKARKPPPNANIRVEFKKAPVASEEDLTKKFFVKPDGRKPRVKSNIRARLADKGQFPFEESEPTGFRHSTKVDDFQFNGDKELENVDNTQKREINSADLNPQSFLNPEEQSWSEIAEKNSGEFVTPVHSLAPPEQNPQSVVQSKVDTSPTFPSAPTHQISPIFKPEPLTLNTRPSNSPSALLEQIVVKPADSVSAGPSADNVAFAAGRGAERAERAEPAEQPSGGAGPATPSLSAFQALLSTSKNELSLQLLNHRGGSSRDPAAV